MNDEKIIDLYWARNESAIQETSIKYESLCLRVAHNILVSQEDCEECVNDTYLGMWNAIPPHRPRRLSAFICQITRNLALKKFEYLSASKRNSEAVCSLEELNESVSGKNYVENEVENKRIEQAICAFLNEISEQKRRVFIWRYWYFESIESISSLTGYSQNKIKSMLYRMRVNLREFLESEGIEI